MRSWCLKYRTFKVRHGRSKLLCYMLIIKTLSIRIKIGYYDFSKIDFRVYEVRPTALNLKFSNLDFLINGGGDHLLGQICFFSDFLLFQKRTKKNSKYIKILKCISKYWSSLCKQTKLSHLGYKNPTCLYWQALALKSFRPIFPNYVDTGWYFCFLFVLTLE